VFRAAHSDVDLTPGPGFWESRLPRVRRAHGGIFAAIRGARADGHDFAGQAFAAGAACVLAARPVGGPAVVVPDVTAALGRLAQHVISQLTGMTVIGLTG
jgi:UDP-N-acetylmuramoyl-tripeptide--D-alanyl-D-alanine ligase